MGSDLARFARFQHGVHMRGVTIPSPYRFTTYLVCVAVRVPNTLRNCVPVSVCVVAAGRSASHSSFDRPAVIPIFHDLGPAGRIFFGIMGVDRSV